MNKSMVIYSVTQKEGCFLWGKNKKQLSIQTQEKQKIRIFYLLKYYS